MVHIGSSPRKAHALLHTFPLRAAMLHTVGEEEKAWRSQLREAGERRQHESLKNWVWQVFARKS